MRSTAATAEPCIARPAGARPKHQAPLTLTLHTHTLPSHCTLTLPTPHCTLTLHTHPSKNNYLWAKPNILLRIIAIAILVYVAIRFILRIFGLGGSRKSFAREKDRSRGQSREKHREGDVIIEYSKPKQKKPQFDADDVDYEEIE